LGDAGSESSAGGSGKIVGQGESFANDTQQLRGTPPSTPIRVPRTRPDQASSSGLTAIERTLGCLDRKCLLDQGDRLGTKANVRAKNHTQNRTSAVFIAR
jgi:hypothetical protein